MKKRRPPSPQEHPAAYAAFSVASASTLLVYECQNRLGIPITDVEAGFIVGAAITAFHFARGKVSK